MTGKKAQKRAMVLIVDDHPALRDALATRMADLPDLEVCGEAADEAEALRLVADKKPDIAIIDISLKSGDGLDLIRRIKDRHADVRMLVCSMYSESMYAERALRAGAQGYITKEEATSQIIAAIRHVLAGNVYLAQGLANKILSRAVGGSGGPDRPPIDTLSDRELEVLQRLGKGMNTRRIARQLHLSVKTIETYRSRIREKLDLEDGTDLIRYASQWVLENG
jgi:DNA-binding NarL/FixJ family response regulator